MIYFKSIQNFSDIISFLKDGKYVCIGENKIELKDIEKVNKINHNTCIIFKGGKVIKPYKQPLNLISIHLRTDCNYLNPDTNNFLNDINIEGFDSVCFYPNKLLIEYIENNSYGNWKDFCSTDLSVNFNGIKI